MRFTGNSGSCLKKNHIHSEHTFHCIRFSSLDDALCLFDRDPSVSPDSGQKVPALFFSSRCPVPSRQRSLRQSELRTKSAPTLLLLTAPCAFFTEIPPSVRIPDKKSPQPSLHSASVPSDPVSDPKQHKTDPVWCAPEPYIKSIGNLLKIHRLSVTDHLC